MPPKGVKAQHSSTASKITVHGFPLQLSTEPLPHAQLLRVAYDNFLVNLREVHVYLHVPDAGWTSRTTKCGIGFPVPSSRLGFAD